MLSQTIINKSKTPKTPNIRKEPYTGFIMFSQKYCGDEFFHGLSSGKIRLGFYDYQDSYEVSLYFSRAENLSLTGSHQDQRPNGQNVKYEFWGRWKFRKNRKLGKNQNTS